MQKGVKSVSFDKHKVEVRITYVRDVIDQPRLIKTVNDMGFTALSGPGRGAYKPPVKFAPGMDVAWIAKNGEAVDFRRHLVSGKVTVIDFGAKWCGPCKDVDHALFALLEKHKKIAVRKIDVVDWNRPVVKQHLSGVSKLPYLIIYDQQGKKVRAIVGRKLKLLRQTILGLLR